MFRKEISNPPVRYIFDELMMWHDAGGISFDQWTEPGEIWENPLTKRRIHNLVAISGLLDQLVNLKPRYATKEEISRFHTEDYVDLVERLSREKGGEVGHQARFTRGGYEIALLSAGSLLSAVEAVVAGTIDNAYCLVRPPGHHAIRNEGMGFCIFNNIVIGALHARSLNRGIQRVAVVDYDVHHGNGTQQAFWDDPDALLIDLHQDSNYPLNSGTLLETGGPGAQGSIINIPFPPGSGTGAYDYAMKRVVIPALKRFKPDIILVSSGFDSSYADPLGCIMLSSEAYAKITSQLIEVATDVCNGRILFTHEGGYSKDYVPYCGLAVLEALCGSRTAVQDPYLEEARGWGYQSLQPHQARVIDAVASIAGLVATEGDTPVVVAGGLGEGMSQSEAATVTAIKKLLENVDPERRELVLKSVYS